MGLRRHDDALGDRLHKSTARPLGLLPIAAIPQVRQRAVEIEVFVLGRHNPRKQLAVTATRQDRGESEPKGPLVDLALERHASEQRRRVADDCCQQHLPIGRI
jgi:hypothetical protein